MDDCEKGEHNRPNFQCMKLTMSREGGGAEILEEAVGESVEVRRTWAQTSTSMFRIGQFKR